MSRELLKLAFEAIERGVKDGYWNKDTVDVSTRIQKYLAEQAAQPQQEPVAWMYEQARYGPTDLRGQQWQLALSRLKPWNGNGLVRNVQALYTSPPAQRTWVGLTDDEFGEIYYRFDGMELMRAIEAKLKENNT